MKDDTISMKAALSALNGCTEIYLNNLPPTIFKTDAVEAVTELPPAQPGWIPCTPETMPQESDEYLVTVKWGEGDCDVDIYEYNAYHKEWNDGELYGAMVIAWQPKSNPWEGGCNA